MQGRSCDVVHVITMDGLSVIGFILQSVSSAVDVRMEWPVYEVLG